MELKEILSCLISPLLVVFTWQLEILVTMLVKNVDFIDFINFLQATLEW